MAQLGFQGGFNAATVAPAERPGPVPAGNYNVVIEESDVKANKSGTGSLLVYTARITDGQFAGRKIFGSINLRNQSPQAESIGQAQFSALCHAVGVMVVNDSNQLHGVPFAVRVKIKKDPEGQYEDRNEVTAYEKIGGAAPAAAAGQAAPWSGQKAPAAPAAATSKQAPPWAQKAA